MIQQKRHYKNKIDPKVREEIRAEFKEMRKDKKLKVDEILNELAEKYRLDYGDVKRICYPRVKKLPIFLTQEERKKLLKQPNRRCPTGERNYVLIRLMLATGPRLSEITCLEWKHIDLLIGKMMIREGKGSKDRTLTINEENIELLNHWKERQIKTIRKNRKFIFTTLKGAQLNNRYVQAMLERYGIKAGIEKKVTPHVLRHTFATEFYKYTKDIRAVQKALGHSDLSTTMIYTHIIDEQLENSLREFQNRI